MLNLILLLALVLAVVIWFWVKWYKVRNVGKRGGYLLIHVPGGPAAKAVEIILVQLDKSEINYVSKRLEQDYSIVHCVDITELADFIKRRELKCHEK